MGLYGNCAKCGKEIEDDAYPNICDYDFCKRHEAEIEQHIKNWIEEPEA